MYTSILLRIHRLTSDSFSVRFHRNRMRKLDMKIDNSFVTCHFSGTCSCIDFHHLELPKRTALIQTFTTSMDWPGHLVHSGWQLVSQILTRQFRRFSWYRALLYCSTNFPVLFHSSQRFLNIARAELSKASIHISLS